MTIEADRDLAGLRRVGRVVALALREMKAPNHFDGRLDFLLTKGLVNTIEPIIASGSDRIVEGLNGWTIKTAAGSPTAHHEHTVVITKGSPTALTAG
jgi:methionyl aminopeptidase